MPQTMPTLKPGDTIGIMATSSRTDPARVQNSAKTLESMGYKIKIHPQTFATYTTPGGTLTSAAGTPAEKVAAFHELWDDPEVKAIMSARGGNEAAEMLPLMDYRKISATPKSLIGFSDVTALHTGIHKHAGVVTFHGPLLNSFDVVDQGDLTQCFKLLSGHAQDIPLPGSRALRPGTTQGRLLGGNLSVFCSLLGTPHEPDFQDALLFLEDVGDEFSRMNRFLMQLKLAGAFNKISGLIIGGFSDIEDNGRVAFGRTIEDMVEQHTQGTRFPIVMDAPFGHENRLITLPVGARATLKADQAPGLSLL